MSLREIGDRARARYRQFRADLDPGVAAVASTTVERALVEVETEAAGQAQGAVIDSLGRTVAGVYPARWRVDDARWAARSFARAVSGKAPEDYPWFYPIRVDHDAGSHEGDVVVIRLVKSRQAVGIAGG